MAFKYGQTAANTKESGRMGKHVVKGSFGTLTETNMRVSGKMTKLTGMVYICIQMEPNT